jgi:hypothetical protein
VETVTTRARRERLGPAIRELLRSGDVRAAMALEDPGISRITLYRLMTPNDEQQRAALATIWHTHSAEVLNEWLVDSPGSRPYGWWQFSAPRWCRADVPPCCQYLSDAQLREYAEPRLRLGGVGDPDYEHLHSAPEFRCGVPCRFIDAWEVEFYTRDGSSFAGHAIDPSNPPTFESEASYLDRHNLLTDHERRVLPESAYDAERILANIEDDEDTP